MRTAIVALCLLPAVQGHLAAQGSRLCPAQEADSAYDADFMPQPPKVLKAVPPKPEAQLLNGRPQETVLSFVVDTTGHVVICSVRIISETSHAWTNDVISGLGWNTFTPGQVDGHPVAARVLSTVALNSPR